MNNVALYAQYSSSVDMPYLQWTPQRLAAPLGWYSTYDPDALLQSAGKATTMLNMMRGSQYNLTQAVTGNQIPVTNNLLNGAPGLVLPGTNGVCLAAPTVNPYNFGPNAPFSVTVVFTFNSTSADLGSMFGNQQLTGQNGWSATTYGAIISLHIQGTASVCWARGSTGLTNGQTYIAHMTYDGSGLGSGIALYLEVAGAPVPETMQVLAAGTAGQGTSNSGTLFNIGTIPSNATPSKHTIFDVVIAGSVYTSTELNNLTTFFKNLHGLS